MKQSGQNDGIQLAETIKPLSGTFSVGRPLNTSKLNNDNKGAGNEGGLGGDPLNAGSDGSGGDNNDKLFNEATEHMDDGLKVHFSAIKDPKEKLKMAQQVLDKAKEQSGSSGEEGGDSEEEKAAKAAQAAVGEEGDDDEPKKKVVSSFRESLGFETQAEYPESYDGLKQLATDYANDLIEKNKASIIQREFKNNPTLALHDEFIKAGYNSKDFAQFVTTGGTDSIKIDENTPEETLKSIVRNSMTGTSKEVADRVIENLAENDQLVKSAKEIADKINNARSQTLKTIKQNYQNRMDAVNRNREAERVEMVNVLKSKDLGMLKIADNELTKFVEALTKRDDTGLTEIEKKEDALNVKQDLLFKYLVWKDFNVQTSGSSNKGGFGMKDFEGLDITSRLNGGGKNAAIKKPSSMKKLALKLQDLGR